MTMLMPIATMLELPELIVSGCEGGIEIVMLSSLPDDDRDAEPASDRPDPAPDRN